MTGWSCWRGTVIRLLMWASHSMSCGKRNCHSPSLPNDRTPAASPQGSWNLVPGQAQRRRVPFSARPPPLAGGNESTLISLYNPLAHLGLIINPNGYIDPVM